MARPRRKARKLSRAQRHARSPRIPHAAILAYRVAAGRLADSFERQVRRAIFGRLGDFALETARTDAAEDAALDGVSFATSTVFAPSGGVADKVAKNSKAEFRRLGIKLDDEPALSKVTTEWRKQSAGRMERILEKERATITELLADSEHRTPEELEDRIEERFIVTRSKLERAATDDVLTLNAQIASARQQAAGIEEFVWTTADDERVRDSHKALDGHTFRWDDPPVVDGEEAVPGEAPNCRCVAFPVLPELADDEAA